MKPFLGEQERGWDAPWEQIKIRGGEWRVKKIDAYQTLLCAAEAARLAQALRERGVQQEDAALLADNACLAAAAIETPGGEHVFETGEELLKAWGMEDIALAIEAYARVKAASAAWYAPAVVERAQSALQSPEARAKWRVLRAFRTLPSEPAAQKMRDEDFLYCYANLLLDEEETGFNESFETAVAQTCKAK